MERGKKKRPVEGKAKKRENKRYWEKKKTPRLVPTMRKKTKVKQNVGGGGACFLRLLLGGPCNCMGGAKGFIGQENSKRE